MVKVFITGGSGWVGSHTVPELIKHGHKVVALARSDDAAKKLESLGATVVRGGLEDTDVLSQQASKADAVLHLAYIHDFTDTSGRVYRTDEAAIRAFGSALEGTNKVLVTTNGFIGCPVNATESDPGLFGPRKAAEALAFSYAAKGVRPVSMRLASSVHGSGDWGFVAALVKIAREKGYAAYPDDGSSRWPGVSVDDAAVLYRLAIEKDLPSAQALHGVEGPPYTKKQIANIIGKKLGLEVKSVSGDAINDYYGWLARFIVHDLNPSNEITKKLTGWQPQGPTLLEDLENGAYFD